MQSILDAINEWIKEILIGAINGNLSTMFGDVNEKVGTIAAEVGQTPQGWNANIFSMIQTLSENVIVPIAGLVITYVLCYELISMVTEKNNMHDVDTSMFFKWVFKAFVAVYLVTHTFDITMAVFDMAQHVVSGAAGVIGGSTEIDVAAALASMQDGLDAMEIPELLLLVMETSLVSLCMKIMSVLITVRYINGMIVVPVAYCRTQNPMFYRVDTNRYTPQGRERIHRMLAKSEYGETLLKLSRDNDTNHSIEFCDNRLSRFVASKGKCELSKVSLAFEDVECIYLNPPSQGGTDEYANLRIVHKDIKSLIYSNDVKIIKSLIDLFDCRAPAKIAKLNKWRAKAGLEAINLITINQTLK